MANAHGVLLRTACGERAAPLEEQRGSWEGARIDGLSGGVPTDCRSGKVGNAVS